MTIILIVTTDMTRTGEHKLWHALKGKLIASFGTIKAACRTFDCSPSALRQSVSGKCPEVADRVAAWERSKKNARKEVAV